MLSPAPTMRLAWHIITFLALSGSLFQGNSAVAYPILASRSVGIRFSPYQLDHVQSRSPRSSGLDLFDSARSPLAVSSDGDVSRESPELPAVPENYPPVVTHRMKEYFAQAQIHANNYSEKLFTPPHFNIS